MEKRRSEAEEYKAKPYEIMTEDRPKKREPTIIISVVAGSVVSRR